MRDIENIIPQLNSIIAIATELIESDALYVALLHKGKALHTALQNLTTEEGTSFQKWHSHTIVANATPLISALSENQAYTIEKVTAQYENYLGMSVYLPETETTLQVGWCIKNKDVLTTCALQVVQHTQTQLNYALKSHAREEQLCHQLQQETNRFSYFVENAKEIFYHLDTDGHFLYVADNFYTILGYPVAEILGTNYLPLIHPEDAQACNAFLETLLQYKGAPQEHTYRIKTQEGIYIWQTATISVIHEAHKTYFAGVSREITKFVVAQEQLTQQKQFYEKILDELPIAVAVYDRHQRYEYLNPEAISEVHLRSFAIGKTDVEYASFRNRNTEFGAFRQKKFEEVIATKKPVTWQDEMYNPKTQTTAYHTRNLQPVLDKEGTLEWFIGTGIDLTQIRNSQEEVLQNKKLLADIVENSAVGILVQGPHSEIILNNAAACNMLGLSQDQLVGKTSFDPHWNVVHPDGSPFPSENHPVPQAIKTNQVVSKVIMGVNRPITQDLVWLLVDAVPVFSIKGQLDYVVCSFIDITLQVNAEKKIKASNERFVYSSKATSDVIWDWNLETDSVIIANSYTSTFGFPIPKDELKKGQIEQYIHPEDQAAYQASMLKAMTMETYWEHDYRFFKVDGTYAFVKDKAVILKNATGKAYRMIGAMHDISLEKKLKNAILQSEKKFKDAFNNSGIAMAIINSNYEIKTVNEQFKVLFGFEEGILLNKNLFDLTQQEHIVLLREKINEILKDSSKAHNSENCFLSKQGKLLWGDVTLSVIKDHLNTPQQVIVQIIDVTTKKEILEDNIKLLEEINRTRSAQLNQAENLYKLLAENMLDLVCVHNLDSSLIYVSPSVTHIFGYTKKEALKSSPLHIAHPEDQSRLNAFFTAIKNGNSNAVAQIRFKKQSGHYLWCDIKGKLISEKGTPLQFHTYTRDIAKAKEAELIIKNTLAKERELNELRTNLVSTISHEFRTPMTTIRSSAELILMYLEHQVVAHKELMEKRVHIIVSEIDRIVGLMNTILIISKDDIGKTNFSPSHFDLKKMCEDVMEVALFEQKNKRSIKTKFKGTDFTVFADKALMEYSLFNLINNAFKYSEEQNGEVLLNLTSTKKSIRIAITDFGIGIPIEDHGKIGNTFFRASNTHGIQGTGLGLYIVKTFTQRNAGQFKIKSTLGKGTTALLLFSKTTHH